MPAQATLKEVESPPSVAELQAVLADYRRRGVRASHDVVSKGEKILAVKGALRRMGDDVWPFLEQLGFAAIDTGNNALASICVERLETKFPKSPRVDSIRGLLLQVTKGKGKAREFYETCLSEDENNVYARKRLIALHLHARSSEAQDKEDHLSLQKGIELLVAHLDVVYNDPEAWSQLCDAYEQLGMLQQCVSWLNDLILLQPTNTFHNLRLGETLYTLGDYSEAYRVLCRTLELAGPMCDGGLGRRAGYGIKLCLRRLGSLEPEQKQLLEATEKRKTKKQLTLVSTIDPSDIGHAAVSPKKAKDIDALVAEEILKAYSKGWSEVGDRVAGHDEMKIMQLWLARQAQGPLKGLGSTTVSMPIGRI